MVALVERNDAPRRVASLRRLLRWWPRTIGLRARIVLLVLIALLPTLLLFVIHTRQEREWLLDEAENRALMIARSWNQHNGEYLDEANVLLRLIADISPSGADCQQKLSSLAMQTHWHEEVAIINRNGAVLCSSRDESQINGLLDRDYLADLLGSRLLEISEFKLDGHGQSIAFAGLRLPKGADGVEKAAVTVIDLAEIDRRTAPVAEGVTYATTVLGRDGLILAQNPGNEALLGTRLPSDHPLMPEVNFQIEGATTGRGGDGVDQIYAFTQLPQTGAKIVISLPRSVAIGDEDQAVTRILVTLGIVTVLAAGAAYLLAEMSVLRWVSVLTGAAIAFGRRDLDYRAVVPRGAAEFATLAKAFNGMAGLLADRQQEMERRVAERTAALTAAQSELMRQERYSAIGQLAASVAHELRNPLGAAKNTVHTIHDIAANKQVDIARPISRLERSLGRCERTIANLLDYVYTGELKRRSVRFERWLDECLDAQSLPAGIVLTRGFTVPDAVVALDNGRLALVISNVIDNAVQAIFDADVTPVSGTIALTTQIDTANRLTLAIVDSGQGIAAETLPRIFESLFSTRSFGLGLGLPTARKIVEQHQGTMSVESAIGQGTRVIITLPLGAERSGEAEPIAAYEAV